MPFRQAFLSFTRFPLWLSSAWLQSRHNLGGVTGGRKMEEAAVVSLTWLFTLLNHTIMCH